MSELETLLRSIGIVYKWAKPIRYTYIFVTHKASNLIRYEPTFFVVFAAMLLDRFDVNGLFVHGVIIQKIFGL